MDSLRPEKSGKLIVSGDIDNRLKTLFDSLRIPHNKQELPKKNLPISEESPFFCLLEDDSLITSVNVKCDRLLMKSNPKDVFLIIKVKLKARDVIWGNIDLIG